MRVDRMNVLLISTYELGRQPFGLASAAAWLGSSGHQVICADLSVDALPEDAVPSAGLIALYLPMHTATRLGVRAIEKIRKLNPNVHVCCFGLYAPLNESYLKKLGVETILGGEFEAGLLALADQLARGSRPSETVVSLDRLQFRTPTRAGLPPLEQYAQLRVNGAAKLAGYTEASRGCKHLCRHCPVVPVYRGAFRIVQPAVVLEDIRQQVAVGSRAHFLRRSGFFQRAHARHAHCGSIASRVSKSDLRRHHQDRAPAASIVNWCRA